MPEVAKLQIAKGAWWQSVGVGDPLASYDEDLWYISRPASARLRRNMAREKEPNPSAAYALSVWVYLPASRTGKYFACA